MEQTIRNEIYQVSIRQILRYQINQLLVWSGALTLTAASAIIVIIAVLKDLDFPAGKDKIIQFLIQQKSPAGDILSSIQNIEDRQYQNVSDVVKPAGLVY